MVFGIPWLAVANVATGIGVLGLLYPTWSVRDRPGVHLWMGVVVTIAGCTLTYGFGLMVFEQALRELFETVSIVFLVWTAVFFLAFALAYTGRADVLNGWWMRGVVFTQGVATALLLSNPVHGLFWTDFDVSRAAGAAAATYSNGPALFLFAGFSYVLVGIGVVLLVNTVTDFGPSHRRKAVAIAVTPVLPVAVSLVWLFEIGPYPHMSLIALAFLPHVLLDAYALFNREVFETPPGVRRAGERAALDDLGSPVFIVADDGRVLDLNSEAAALFGVADERVRGDQLAELLGTSVSLDDPEQMIELRVGGKRRQYKLVSSPFETAGGMAQGYTVICQDVTAETQRKQRLDVLNRILRHNLRNDLNVLQLHASELETLLGNRDARRHVQAIESKSEEIVDLGEKTRAAARALEDVTPQHVRAIDLLDDVVDDVTARYPAAQVTVDVPGTLHLETDPQVLELVFTSVVENAIKHNDGDRPVVTIDTTEDEDDPSLHFRIRDDGPGIPKYERAVIEHGAETALEHGSGVGLWVIHWGVTILGGDVDFEVHDDGTTVWIRVPGRVDS